MFPQAFYIGNTMISKILSIIKSKFKQKKVKENHIVQEGYAFLDDVSAEILIQVSLEGDFVISFDAKDSNIDAVPAVGNLIFLINSGALSTFFIKSLELWADEAEGEKRDEREVFVSLIMAQWQEIQEEHQEALNKMQEPGQKNGSQSAVDPSRVFNLRKYL